VEQLLLGSRAGADQLAVSNAPFDLAGLLRGAVTAFRPLSDQHALTVDIPDGLPKAYGDPTATDVIVGQLLENAFKYSPDGGKVIVRAKKDGDQIHVMVEDEGVGIPAEDRERVFERFVQGETGDRRRFGGIGLGLYIVRQLAQAQDGEIAAEGREGGGTVMRLRLRRAGAPAGGPLAAAAPPAPAAKQPAGG
jgi:two-component system, NtrC family, sensor histidine kinase KinB